MTFQEIVTLISKTEQIPAGKVRQVSKALLEVLGRSIETGEKLQLPGLVFVPKTRPAQGPSGDQPARDERKIAILRPKAKV